jgi:hypothetical protein
MSPLQQWLGTLKTVAYRQPRDELKRLWRWGPHAYLRCNAWAREMEQAAWHLPCPRYLQTEEHPVSVWFMTGSRHWYQTAFCAWTLQQHIPLPLRIHLIDDGTLASEQKHRLRELFPLMELSSRAECDSRIAALLPPDRFPRIHTWRNIQLLFRKLTDIHADSTNWKLFLDSDMLFYQRPDELLSWWKAPDRCIFQTDCWESYGYSRALTESLTGQNLPSKVNIGIFSLNGSLIDWDEVERWLHTLEMHEGRRYNVTQCITTMIMSRLSHERLDATRYFVFPGPGSPPATTSRVLEHYVSDAKPYYVRTAWRRATMA